MKTKLNKEIDDLLDGIDFQQSLSQEKSPTCIPSSFPEENEDTSGCDQENSREEEVSSPLLFSQKEKSPEKYDCEMDTLEEVPVTITISDSIEKNEQKYRNDQGNMQEIAAVPIIQPFTCSEEKSLGHYDDPMDIIGGSSCSRHIEDTYLTDAEFNEKYPQHPIDVSFSQ